MSDEPTSTTDADLDALLRAALVPRDQPAARIAAVRTAARDELRRATGRADTRRRAWRAVEATAAFSLGAAQLVWALVSFLDRPY